VPLPQYDADMHAIIIPYRDREESLWWCLTSIALSEESTGIDDFSIFLVTDDNVPVVDDSWPFKHELRFTFTEPSRLFNKSALLNAGIARAIDAGATILTFLDADAIVGFRWLEGVRCLDADALTYICYRVRYVGRPILENLNRYRSLSRLAVSGLVSHYQKYWISGELYGSPDSIYQGPWPPPPVGSHVFGNSQLSIRVDKLGDLRFNEAFEGRGFEDQWFIRELWRREGCRFCAAMLTEPHRAMFHIHLPQKWSDDHPWNNRSAFERNETLYRST